MNRKNLMLMAILGTLFSAFALAGPHFGKHGMHHPLEKMIDSIDLNSQQEGQVEQILDELKQENMHKRKRTLFKELVKLDPESSQYQEQVEMKAAEAGKQLERHIVALAKARQDIYELLDEEQKSQLSRTIQKRLKRMEKYERND